jgi:hypothetical protein
MTLPWMQIFDAAIGVIDLVRSRRIRSLTAQAKQLGPQQLVDTGLADVVAATLREELERDRLRAQREREELEEAERQRAEFARKVALQREAGDREIGRLRLLTGVAVAGWLGTLLLGTLLETRLGTLHGSVTGGHLFAKVLLGFGWALLLAAIAASFAAQGDVARRLVRIAGGDARAMKRGVSSGLSGALALWLIVAGLALAGLAMLVA